MCHRARACNLISYEMLYLRARSYGAVGHGGNGRVYRRHTISPFWTNCGGGASKSTSQNCSGLWPFLPVKQLPIGTVLEGYAQTFIATPLTYLQGRKAPGIRPLIGARSNSRCLEELLVVPHCSSSSSLFALLALDGTVAPDDLKPSASTLQGV